MPSASLKTKSLPRDVGGIAFYRVTTGNEVAARLYKAASAADSRAGKSVAARIARCCSLENVWVGDDLHREDDGDLYKGIGTLWACHQRLCPSCAATLSRQSRMAARAALVRVGRGDWNMRWRFVTLTMPTEEGAGVVKTIDLVNRAFGRLINREFWKSRVRAGIKGVEFTVTERGYHTHIHLMLFSDFIPRDAGLERKMRDYSSRRNLAPGNLAAEWTYCLKSEGLRVPVNTASGDVVTDVQAVKVRGADRAVPDIVSLEHALQEVCKYVTKAESYTDPLLSDAHLLELAEVERWPRMFELLGAARAPRQTRAELEQEEQRAAEFRRAEALRLAAWIDADPRALREDGTCGTGSALELLSDEFLQAAEAASKLDTQLLKTGENANDRASPNGRGSPRERSPSLRALLDVLPWQEWLRVLELRVTRTQRFRRAMLAGKFPFATFSTLDGATFGAEA